MSNRTLYIILALVLALGILWLTPKAGADAAYQRYTVEVTR